MSLSKLNPVEPPWYVTRMPGGVGGVVPRGVPLSRSIPPVRVSAWVSGSIVGVDKALESDGSLSLAIWCATAGIYPAREVSSARLSEQAVEYRLLPPQLGRKRFIDWPCR